MSKRSKISRIDMLFHMHIKNLNPKVVFEFGSFDLKHGLYYKRLWPKAVVYCFEPNPELFAAGTNLANGAGINFYDYAISDKTGWADFHPSVFVKGTAGPSGSLLKHTDYHIENQLPCQVFPDVIKVKTITIKEFCDRHSIEGIDFMHADIEGATFEVINGFGGIRPKLIRMEVEEMYKLYENSPTQEQVTNLLSKKGYRVKFQGGGEK